MSGLPLAGRTALVTGGTRGIGQAIARRLQSEGACVSITGVSERTDTTFSYHAVDFSDIPSTEAFAERVSQWEVDILVNNAGINKIAPFDKVEPGDFYRIQSVNTFAPFLLCRAVLPSMRRKKWGRIVNISSIFGIVSKEYRAPYSASKFALDGMTVALAAEVAQEGILANCVAPGCIDTDLTRTVLGEEGIAKLVASIPVKRLGTVEEVAALAYWLVGPENTYITGQNIVIDGGFTRV